MDLSEPDAAPLKRLTISEAVLSGPEAALVDVAGPEEPRLLIRDERRELLTLLVPDTGFLLPMSVIGRRGRYLSPRPLSGAAGLKKRKAYVRLRGIRLQVGWIAATAKAAGGRRKQGQKNRGPF
jgi:hypothetical protein